MTNKTVTTRAKITNVRHGVGRFSHVVYANLTDEQGETLITATLEYIMRAVKDRQYVPFA